MEAAASATCGERCKREECERRLQELVPLDSIRKNTMDYMVHPFFMSMKKGLIAGSMAEVLYLPQYKQRSNGEILKSVVSDIDTMGNDGYPVLGVVTVTDEQEIGFAKDFQSTTEPCFISDHCLVSVKGGWDNIFVIQSDACRPGYYWVGCRAENHCGRLDKRYCLCSHSCLFPRHLSRLREGPADTGKVNVERYLHDDITSIPCMWPDNCLDIFNRPSPFWPRPETLQALKTKGQMFIVRKPHPESKKYPELELRLSSSVPEAILSKSLPDSLRHVYLTVKLLAKTTFTEESVLKSFHLKTGLFWLASEAPLTEWEHGSFRSHVLLLLNYLKDAFENRSLPHFLTPDLNLLENVSESDGNIVVTELARLMNNLCHEVKNFVEKYQLDWAFTSRNWETLLVWLEARRHFKLSLATSYTRIYREGKAEENHFQIAMEAYADIEHKEQDSRSPAVFLEQGLLLLRQNDIHGATMMWLNSLDAIFDSCAKSVKRNWHIEVKYSPMFHDDYTRLVGMGANSVHDVALVVYLIIRYSSLSWKTKVGLMATATADFIGIFHPALETDEPDLSEFPSRSMPFIAASFIILGLYTNALECLGMAMNSAKSSARQRALFEALVVRLYRHRQATGEQTLRLITRLCQQLAVTFQMMDSVDDICAAVVEYTRDFRPSFQLGRRHSFSHSSMLHWKCRIYDMKYFNVV